MTKIRFLSAEEVVRYHDAQIVLFGGALGVRDAKLLASAVANPKATFASRYLYKDIFAMAAAYMIGIIKNHPFVDGNKRTGTISSIMFLRQNNQKIVFKDLELYVLARGIAISEFDHRIVAQILRDKSLA